MKDFLNLKKDPNKNLDKDGLPKKPENIFSKPIDVRQTEEARKSRLKIVIIEGLLFGAFLTAITAIYSISGLSFQLTPEQPQNAPSIFFYLLEFVVFSALVGVGDYFLTEKRVNDYNQKVHGMNINIDDEIAKALSEQEAEGITKEQAMAANKSDGQEEESEQAFEIVDAVDTESDVVKALVAKNQDDFLGKISCRKGYILDTMGIEQQILVISAIEKSEKLLSNNVISALFEKARDFATESGMLAVVTSGSLNTEFTLNLSDVSKYSLKVAASDEKYAIKITETYPGSLMGVSGTIELRGAIS